MEISYKLENFEGPLDLLLHLIENKYWFRLKYFIVLVILSKLRVLKFRIDKCYAQERKNFLRVPRCFYEASKRRKHET